MTSHPLLEPAVDIARRAGAVLMSHFRQPLTREQKSSDIDFATAADRESEAFIVSALMQLTPDYHIVGEEGGGYGADRTTAPYLWLVDPLDGTVNFASNLPYFSVVLALTTPDLQPVLGVVYDPNRDEVFHAVKGKGAFCNGRPMRVSDTRQLSDALICSGFPYDRRTNPDNNIKQWTAFILKVRDLRRLGSAALDMCYVADNRLDGFWERSLNPWDAVASMLIVREAGGVVTDYDGHPDPQHQPGGRYMAANPHIHPQMMAIMQESYRDPCTSPS